MQNILIDLVCSSEAASTYCNLRHSISLDEIRSDKATFRFLNEVGSGYTENPELLLLTSVRISLHPKFSC